MISGSGTYFGWMHLLFDMDLVPSALNAFTGKIFFISIVKSRSRQTDRRKGVLGWESDVDKTNLGHSHPAGYWGLLGFACMQRAGGVST